MYRKGSKGWLKHWDFILLDVFCMQAAVTLAHFTRFGFRNPFASDDYWGLSVLLLLSNLVTTLFFEPYKNILKRGDYRELAELIKHVALVLLAATFYLFSAREGSRYSRIVFYIFGASYAVLSFAVRIFWKRHLLSRPSKEGKRALFLVTSAEAARQTVKEIKESCYGIFRIAGLAVTDCDLRGKEIEGVRVDAFRDDITNCLMKGWVDEVLINLPQGGAELAERDGTAGKTGRTGEQRSEKEAAVPDGLVSSLTEMGLAVHIRLQEIPELAGQKQFVEKIGRSMVLTTSLNCATTGQAFLKRLLDVAGGLVGCIITGILCVIIGPMIYIQSPGPIFFRQERVGRNGKRFWMYKFRSMYLDAEKRKQEVAAACGLEGQMMFKLEDDPRIIGSKVLPDGRYKKGIGNFIRDWSLDEFPQFFNVLKGDMSLVGTRPPTVDEWERYELHHRGRLAVKPGITGLWQVSGRSRITDFDEVVRLDKEYIQGWSMEQDLRILVKTVGVVIRKDGAM